MGIMIIPAAITMLLGNNKQLSGYTPVSKNEQESIEQEQLSQEKIIGIVAKEIPIDYEEEAVKSQVIMARSYIASTKDQDFSYMSIEEMKTLWGNDFNKNYSKIKKAVEDTKNIVVTYNNQPVQPLYHIQSSGITQNPLDIWGLEIPYLESVESSWDQTGADLIKEKEYNTQEFIDTINQKYSNPALLSYSLKTQIQIIERTQGGYVKSIQLGNQLISGEDFRKLLDLRSSCFLIEYNNNKVKIITKGTGHGVGLSQYGANMMAKEGKVAEEILKHYFPKAEIRAQN